MTNDELEICQICGGPLDASIVYCAACETPHHRDCWAFHGKCSTYACGCKTFTTERIIGSHNSPELLVIDQSAVTKGLGALSDQESGISQINGGLSPGESRVSDINSSVAEREILKLERESWSFKIDRWITGVKSWILDFTPHYFTASFFVAFILFPGLLVLLFIAFYQGLIGRVLLSKFLKVICAFWLGGALQWLNSLHRKKSSWLENNPYPERKHLSYEFDEQKPKTLRKKLRKTKKSKKKRKHKKR